MSYSKLPSSGGPKTASGKKRSSQNARRHGLFAAEFSFTAADKIEFDKLSADLREVLKPHNALLDLIFQDVVACAWRIRLALRLEQRELQKQFATENEESREEPQRVGVSFPYGLKGRQREQLINLLDSLYEGMSQYGCLPPELEEPFTQAFGPDRWKTLTEFTPLNLESIWVARVSRGAVERSEMFGLESPIGNVSAEEQSKLIDANALKDQEMTLKLIEVYKDVLLATPRSVESEGMLLDERVNRLDQSIRYHTTARRDFYRALREYREAKNLG